jgi:hypothetical protein
MSKDEERNSVNRGETIELSYDELDAVAGGANRLASMWNAGVAGFGGGAAVGAALASPMAFAPGPEGADFGAFRGLAATTAIGGVVGAVTAGALGAWNGDFGDSSNAELARHYGQVGGIAGGAAVGAAFAGEVGGPGAALVGAGIGAGAGYLLTPVSEKVGEWAVSTFGVDGGGGDAVATLPSDPEPVATISEESVTPPDAFDAP